MIKNIALEGIIGNQKVKYGIKNIHQSKDVEGNSFLAGACYIKIKGKLRRLYHIPLDHIPMIERGVMSRGFKETELSKEIIYSLFMPIYEMLFSNKKE